eukprot:SAG31_NODE_36081_length_316_cov_1.866359_1_plen_62_part_01
MALWANGISVAAGCEDYQPKVNGDGKPILPMTAEQKYEFDLQGFIILPGAQIRSHSVCKLSV